jgi:23S rRNA pseudouridine1911/1915/1917 synthase
LHAIKLGLIHPQTNTFMEWQIELAEDMRILLEAMRHEDTPIDEDQMMDFGVDENGLYIGDDDDDWDESDDDFEDELNEE